MGLMGSSHGFGDRLADTRWPDPFCDMASMAMPTTIRDALRWCEYIINANGPYRAALARIISYFLTDIEISAPTGEGGKTRLGREEKQKYEDFLNDTLGIKTVLATVALDYLTYGNSFTSLTVPFRRYLVCGRPGCGREAPLQRVFNTPAYNFSWTNYQFVATCPSCGFRGVWKHIDRRSADSDQLKVKRWSPHMIDILHDPYTDDTAYIWRIDDDYRSLVRAGRLFHLERASWEIVQAVKNGHALLFDPGVIYHMKEETLSGMRNRGWGFSRVLTNFRQAWYVQVLHRQNESIALDFVTPLRIITPQARQGQSAESIDPVLSLNMGDFASRMEGVLRRHRQDPARWEIFPTPVEYQALGGDATQLAPKDLLELGLTTLLDSIGVPVDLYKGTLTMQAAIPAMRLFEANWSHLTHGLNRFLAALVDKVAQLMSWEPVNCKLQRTTHADDINRQMAQLQLMMGGQISRTTGLNSVGLDFGTETRLKLEEERTEAEATQEMQTEMEHAEQMNQMTAPADQQQGGDPATGGAAPGGQPPAAGGAAQAFAAGQPLLPHKPTTPEEMQQMASTLAQQLMSLSDSQRTSALIQLKQEDQTMHALVSAQIDDMRQQAQTQGQQLILQQQFGKQGAAIQQYPVWQDLRSIIGF